MSVSAGEPSCGIAVMAKASIPGRTKTRLVPPLDFDEAARFNTAFLKDVFANVLEAARDTAIAGHAAGGPPGADEFFAEILPEAAHYFECWHGDFGLCLREATAEMFARGHTGAIVLNSDSPTLPPALLVEAARILARPGDRAVLGPSTDGGYYLLGLNRLHERMFQDIDWSTERVADQTIARAREIGLEILVLPQWYDVDDADSLRRLHGEIVEGRIFDASALRPAAADHSATLMREMAGIPEFRRRLGLDLPGAVAQRRLA